MLLLLQLSTSQIPPSPFFLGVDASLVGVGADLSKWVQGKIPLVIFSYAEKNCSRELLAIKLALSCNDFQRS